MSKLQLCTYHELRRIAEGLGYRYVRTRGSHAIYRDARGRTVTIAGDGADVVKRPMLRSLIKQLGLTPRRYEELLRDLW